MNLAEWRKGIIAVLTALAAVGTSLPDGAPSWLPAVCTIAGAVLVILVPNAPTAAQRAQVALSVEDVPRPKARRGRVPFDQDAPPRPPGKPLE